MFEAVGIRGAALLENGRIRIWPGGETRSFAWAVDNLDNERAMDDVSRAASALAVAVLDVCGSVDRERTGVIFGSGYGAYEANLSHLDEVTLPGPASPAVFSRTQPNIPAAWMSISCGLKGTLITAVDGFLGGSKALGTAVDCLKEGSDASLLVGATCTVDPRVLAALDCALDGNFRRPGALGGAVLVLGPPDSDDRFRLGCLGPFFIKTHRLNTAQFAKDADLIVPCRPGQVCPDTEIPCLRWAEEAGDFMEAAGPAGVATALMALVESGQKTAHVMDKDPCGREGMEFFVEARHEP
jgi:hypothetical protein